MPHVMQSGASDVLPVIASMSSADECTCTGSTETAAATDEVMLTGADCESVSTTASTSSSTAEVIAGVES